jgi:hypothetical protein
MVGREGAKAPTKDPELTEPAQESTTQQRKRPERGRYLLQVDRQTKESYAKSETAEAAGLVIKTGHPILQVAVYDAVECVSKTVELPEKA